MYFPVASLYPVVEATVFVNGYPSESSAFLQQRGVLSTPRVSVKIDKYGTYKEHSAVLKRGE